MLIIIQKLVLEANAKNVLNNKIQNMIILEGLDKTGKTTLANKLKEIGYNVVKCNVPENAFNEYMTKALEADDMTVFDRFHWGETAYGLIKRGKCSLTDKEFKTIEQLLFEKNAIVIYCQASKDFISKKFDEENETFTKKEEIDELKSLFDETRKKSILTVVDYIIPTDIDLFINKLKKYVK